MKTVLLLEESFGSDDAMGVTYDTEQEQSRFPDGRSAVNCTACAMQVVRALGARAQIWGFSEDENPESRIVRDLRTGHDFAIVDGHYLVDPWIKLVDASLPRAVYDFENMADTQTICEWYGDQKKWNRLQDAEAIALREYDKDGERTV